MVTILLLIYYLYHVSEVIMRNFTEENETNSIKMKSKKRKKEKKKNRLSSESYTNIKEKYINDITTVTKLIRFIKNEKMLRKSVMDKDGDAVNNMNNNCLTKNMDKLQWRMFQKFIKDKIQEINDNPDKKKCILDYLKKEIKICIS